MFKSTKIRALENDILILKGRLDTYVERYWNLYQGYYALLDKLGLKEERVQPNLRIIGKESK